MRLFEPVLQVADLETVGQEEIDGRECYVVRVLGREKARTFLKENPDMTLRLAEEVYLAKGLKLAVPFRQGLQKPEIV